jgi:hypothetical protein
MSFILPRTFLRRFCASTQGTALMEFALIFPLLATILIGANEYTRWMRASQHMQDYATMIASDISGASQEVSPYTLAEMIERIGLVAPELVDPSRGAWGLDEEYLSVTITMAMMSNARCLPGQTGCTYTPTMAWSYGRNKRCTWGDPRPMGGVPQGLDRQPGPVVIVDVKSKYKFVFGLDTAIVAEPTLSTTVWRPVRNWRGSATFPPLASPFAAGSWTGVKCI